jgi:hypothetical protein
MAFVQFLGILFVISLICGGGKAKRTNAAIEAKNINGLGKRF